MSVPPELMNAMPGADLSSLPAPAGMQPSKYARKPVAKQPVARSGMSPEPTAMQAASDAGAEGEKMLMSDLGQYRSDVGRVRQASQEADAYEREHPPEMPATFQEQAPQYADFAKQVSPLLMIATVLGGKAMGISAQGMLGAVTGMVEGTAQGNEQRYTEAYQNYKDHYARFKEEEANRVAYRDKMLEWYKGRIDAPQLAAQASLQLVSADEKIVNMGINADKAASQVAKDLAAQADRAARLNTEVKALQLATDKFKFKQDQDKDKAISVLSKYKTSAFRMRDSWVKLKEYVAKHPEMKTLLNTATLFDSAKLEKILGMGDSEGAALLSDFKSDASAFMGPGFRDQIQGIPASALRSVKVDQAEMAALPNLQKVGWNQTDATINRIIDELSKADLSGKSESAPQGRAPLSEEDQQAIAWARAHMDNPKARQILQMHGEQ